MVRQIARENLRIFLQGNIFVKDKIKRSIRILPTAGKGQAVFIGNVFEAIALTGAIL